MNEYLGDFLSGMPGKSLYSVELDATELPDGLVLVHAMSGFIDAGSAGRIAAEHLLESLDHQRVITFDHDLLIDYRSRRPVMTFENSQWTSYDEPVLAIDVVWDTTGTPFLDRKSTRLNSSHVAISYSVFCLKKQETTDDQLT